MLRYIEMLIMMAIPVVISAIVTQMSIERYHNEKAADRQQKAQFVIVDVASVAAEMVKAGNPNRDDANLALVKVMAEIETLKNNGYVVLDANAVINAPSQYYYARP